MARHGYGKVVIDSFIEVPQRTVLCNGCGSSYSGMKEKLKCRGCGAELTTQDVACKKKVPTGIWNVTTQRASKPKG